MSETENENTTQDEPQASPAADAAATPSAGPSDSAVVEPTKTNAKQRSNRHVPRSERRRRPKRVRANTTGERKPIVRGEQAHTERGRRQERRGVVVSDAMDKTIVVKVEAVRSHQKYKKVIRRSVKFHAHDERNEAKVGDVVRIVETRPLSKSKNWRLVEIVEAAK